MVTSPWVFPHSRMMTGTPQIHRRSPRRYRSTARATSVNKNTDRSCGRSVIRGRMPAMAATVMPRATTTSLRALINTANRATAVPAARAPLRIETPAQPPRFQVPASRTWKPHSGLNHGCPGKRLEKVLTVSSRPVSMIRRPAARCQKTSWSMTWKWDRSQAAIATTRAAVTAVRLPEVIGLPHTADCCGLRQAFMRRPNPAGGSGPSTGSPDPDAAQSNQGGVEQHVAHLLAEDPQGQRAPRRPAPGRPRSTSWPAAGGPQPSLLSPRPSSSSTARRMSPTASLAFPWASQAPERFT